MEESSPSSSLAVVETSDPKTSSDQEVSFSCNWDAVKELERDNELLASGCVVALTTVFTAATAMTVPLVVPVGVVGLSIAKWTQWRADKDARLLQLMKALLGKFEGEGVEIYKKIPVAGMNPIDLFIRFPQKAHLIVSVRSKGDTEIVYNETTEDLRVRKKNGTTNRWHPNPLVELADQERWLAKNRWRFGMTSKEASKTPTAKVLVLWEPTKAAQHRDELYSEVGALKVLSIRRKGTAFVIQQEDLLNFVTAWLARYE